MSHESETLLSVSAEPPADSEPKPLCVGCLTPHEPGGNFCRRCGAPLTSYAATGFFESTLAEGHVYRRAAENPRHWIVLVGVWVLFGFAAVGGIILLGVGLVMGHRQGIEDFLMGAFLLPVSLAMIAKTTRNYFARPPIKAQSADSVPG